MHHLVVGAAAPQNVQVAESNCGVVAELRGLEAAQFSLATVGRKKRAVHGASVGQVRPVYQVGPAGQIFVL